MRPRDETSDGGATARRRRAEERADRAAQRRQEAEREADATLRPDLADRHRIEAELHGRAERLHHQAADIQKRHAQEHGDA